MRLSIERLEFREVPAAYTVAVTGSDTADGIVTPWRTLQHAADRVAPGDTVSVQPGNYAGLVLTTSGTPAARITFAAQPGVTVTSPNAWGLDGINLEGAGYVTVQGFAVNGMPRTGLRAVNAAGVEFKNNTADGNGVWGILTGWCDDLLVEGNVTSRSKQQHGIYVGNSGDRPVIRGNVCWGNDDCGIHLNGDVFTGGGDGIISNAVIENNVLYSNGVGGGSSLNMDGVQDSLVRNNLIYDAKAGGIALFRIDGGGPSSNNQITNNTVLVGSTGRWAVAVSGGSTGNTLKNNVIFSSHPFRGAVSVTPDSLPGFASDYNAVEDRFSTDDGDSALALADWRTATGLDLHSFAIAGPSGLFTAGWELAAGSPLIDSGTAVPSSPTQNYDWEGNVRPQGNGWDIGHDEFPVPVPISPPPPASPPPPPPVAGKPTSKPPKGVDRIAVGAAAGGAPHVKVYDASGKELFSFFAFDRGFTGGVRVATADLDGDGTEDIVAAAGPGGAPHVKVFDGVTGKEVRSFFAYDAAFRGGVWVAASGGEIVTGAGDGGGPHVRVWGRDGLVREWMEGDPGTRRGVNVAFVGTALSVHPGGLAVPAVLLTLDGREIDPFPGFRGGIYVG